MSESTSTKPRSLAEIFNASGSHFDEVTPYVWGPAGAATIKALNLRPGDHVLDACAGSGASALPAAVAVAPTGQVLAVDLAADLLALGKAAAERQGLRNISFRTGDVTTMRFDRRFDAVCCAYGVFFLPSMDSDVTTLLRAVRPGGRFAFTVWHDDALYDFTKAFLEAVTARSGGPGAFGGSADGQPHPITRIDTEAKISAWASSLGAVEVTTTVERIRVPRSDDFCWALVLGSGLRGHLLDLDAGHIADVRDRFLALLTERGISEIKCDSLIVSGRTPDSGDDN